MLGWIHVPYICIAKVSQHVILRTNCTLQQLDLYTYAFLLLKLKNDSSTCHLQVPRKRLHHLYTVFYTLRGSANWCTGQVIKGLSKKVYSDNAACEKACTDNADCHFYGRRHENNMCEFWELDECHAEDYILSLIHI